MPTFHFIKGSNSLGSVRGADISSVESNLLKFASSSAGTSPFSSGGYVLGSGKPSSHIPSSTQRSWNIVIYCTILFGFVYFWWNNGGH
jgi:hypothetical protein